MRETPPLPRNAVGKLICAKVGILWLVGTMVWAGPPDLSTAGTRLRRFEFTRVEMAMPVRIVLYSESEEAATKAATAAFDRFRILNGILSDYDPESEVSRLSRSAGSGQCIPVSDDLWRVLERARQVSEATNGAFDITIGPVSRLWRRSRRRGELPPPDRLEETLRLVDYRSVRLAPDRQCVTLLQGSTMLDLGGIGKGFAIDEALSVLRQHGANNALVDASGDIGLGDAPPGAPGWRIGIASSEPDAPPEGFLWLANVAIAQSGDLWQHVEIQGKRYSHIVDPKTGLGLTDRSSVTVVAANAMTADAFASGVSVMGPERGLTLIETMPGVAARYLHAPEGKVRSYASSAWKELKPAPQPE